MSRNIVFTSESVCAGHPDKICDQISDAIVDAALRKDEYSRVAVETLVTKNKMIVAGEVTCKAKLDYEKIARDQVKRLGYIDPKFNFTSDSPIDVYVHEQSNEIACGVDLEGAGDQGMMFGYACSDTVAYMPLPIELSSRLAERIDFVRESGILNYLRPDGKTQVTIDYKNDQPVGVRHLVLAVPHEEKITLEQVKVDLYQQVVLPTLSKYNLEIKQKDLIVNGTGVWNIGGPALDTGLTGRKIIVDTYGGYAKVGGGAFSGKDATKVDRSGAYAARYIAKNIVAHGLATKVEVRLAYFIGAKRPLMQEVETFGTSKVSAKAIKDFAGKLIDTSVRGIIEKLDLRKPVYLPTAVYGHFGRDGFSWEEIT